MERQSIEDTIEVPKIQLESVLGFNGTVKQGLKVHPDGGHIIYPLGSAVVIEEIKGIEKPRLLQGHTNSVTCIVVSMNGGLLASGQETHTGLKALAIVWNYSSLQPVYKLELHKGKVQALDFSPNNKYLASLGGNDDGSVVLWDMTNGKPIAGSPAHVKSEGLATCISYSNDSDNLFITGGEGTLRMWEADVENRKLRPTDVRMGQIKRNILCITIDPYDTYFFCGTSTGDILEINMASRLLQSKTDQSLNFEAGVTSLVLLKNNRFLIGTGSGELCELGNMTEGQLQLSNYKKTRSWVDTSVPGSDNAITSIALRGDGHQFYVGTANARVYKFGFADELFDFELIKTCHSKPVNDVIFQPGSSDTFLTCQEEQIRIWATQNMREVTSYVVPNMTCNAIAMACNGEAIVSAWDYGIIRVFGFNEQASSDIVLKKEIETNHDMGVSAIACTWKEANCSTGEWDFNIVSGGEEGLVQIWRFYNSGHDDPTYDLIATIKGHKSLVSDIKISKDGNECVSSSNDGTCIIWDLKNQSKKLTVYANTLFKCVNYSEDETQIITSGTDRKVAYWEVLDGSEIRELEGSETGPVNAMDISADGQYFVTGGDDKLLKVWTYIEGEVIAVGTGHSAPITRVRICPQQRYICSVSVDGAVLLWTFPFSIII